MGDKHAKETQRNVDGASTSGRSWGGGPTGRNRRGAMVQKMTPPGDTFSGNPSGHPVSAAPAATKGAYSSPRKPTGKIQPQPAPGSQESDRAICATISPLAEKSRIVYPSPRQARDAYRSQHAHGQGRVPIRFPCLQFFRQAAGRGNRTSRSRSVRFAMP